ncbi:MAG: Rieske (2Fe-2S) protein [Candidatus Saccharimonadales bacterium]
MKNLLFIAAMAIALSSCVKTGGDIPNVAVNFSDATTDPRLAPLNVPGGAVLINGGVAGLILYREADGSYAAYDRCSTVNPQLLHAVTLDQGNFTVTDSYSGGKWSLIDGTPVKAPAVISLKSYNVDVANFQIFVSN